MAVSRSSRLRDNPLGAYSCAANTCRYVGPLQESRQAFATRMETALAQVITELGSLRIGIVGESTSAPYFVRIDSVDMSSHIWWKKADSEASLLRLLEDQHDQLWQDVDRRPAWAIIVVEGVADSAVDISFAVHHALCDGKSTAVFHTHLLSALNSPRLEVPGLQGHILGLSDRRPVVAPSLKEMAKLDVSWSFFLWTLWTDIAPSWLQPPPPWSGKTITMEPRHVNLRLVTIPQASVRRLLAACRAEGTTLTGLLHALTLASLSRRIPAAVATTFRGDTPISLLPFASAPPGLGLERVLSNLNSMVVHDFDTETVARFRAQEPPSDSSETWTVAHRVRAELKQHLDIAPKDDVVGVDALGQVLEQAMDEQDRQATWCDVVRLQHRLYAGGFRRRHKRGGPTRLDDRRFHLLSACQDHGPSYRPQRLQSGGEGHLYHSDLAREHCRNQCDGGLGGRRGVGTKEAGFSIRGPLYSIQQPTAHSQVACRHVLFLPSPSLYMLTWRRR